MSADVNALYGAGFAYPYTVSSGTGGVATAEAVDSVRASLARLFDTAPGEQFMLPEYGCELKNLVFEQDSEVLRALCDAVVRDAIRRWEPRIAEVLDLTVDRDDALEPNTLTIQVTFRLIESQRAENFVYPLNVPF